jgi:hypothetical protein
MVIDQHYLNHFHNLLGRRCFMKPGQKNRDCLRNDTKPWREFRFFFAAGFVVIQIKSKTG